MDSKARKVTAVSMLVILVWLSFKGQMFMPQWSLTAIYYFMIACTVYMISSIKKEQNTLEIKRVKHGDEEKVEYEIRGKTYTEEETILWIARKMDVEKKEAKRFLNEVVEKGDTKSNE